MGTKQNEIKDWTIVQAGATPRDSWYTLKHLEHVLPNILIPGNQEAGFINPLEVGTDKASLDEKEAKFRLMMESTLENDGRSQVEYMANYMLEMVAVQKEILHPEWYKRLFTLFSNYLK